MEDVTYKVVAGVAGGLLLVFVVVPYMQKSSHETYLDFRKEYPPIKKADEINGIVTDIDESSHGLRKGFGVAVKFDSLSQRYLGVNKELNSGKYIFNHIDIGDRVYKKKDNDTLFVKKEDHTYQFLLNKNID